MRAIAWKASQQKGRKRQRDGNLVKGARRLAVLTPSKELKALDVNNSGSSPNAIIINSSGSFTLLNPLLTGADLYQRIGRKVNMKSLHLIGKIACTGANTLGSKADYQRIMVVYDRQPTLSSLAPLLQTVDSGGNTSNTAYDFTNISNADRFEILADIRVDIDGTNQIQDNNNQSGGASSNISDYKGEYNINRYIKLSKGKSALQAHFDVGSTATPTSGALYLVTVGSIGAGQSPYTLYWTSRLRFYDV